MISRELRRALALLLALALALLLPLAWAAQPQPDYCSLCEPQGSHTMCLFPMLGPGENCSGYRPAPLSEREKRSIVRTHNVIRSRVATGRAWARASEFEAQPQAADMRQMYWDDEMAVLAQRWADQCIPFYTGSPHDACRDTVRFPVGQNIVTTAYSRPAESDVRARTLDWYGEMTHFDPGWVGSFRPNPDPDPRKQIGHYTQMVWAWSYAIGCARVVFEEQFEEDQEPWTVERLVCNYAPSGNFLRYPVYTAGEPCSACPAGTVCSERYPGLCAVEGYDWRNEEETEDADRSHGPSPTSPQMALLFEFLPLSWWKKTVGRPRASEHAHDTQRIIEEALALEAGEDRPEHFTPLGADSEPISDSDYENDTTWSRPSTTEESRDASTPEPDARNYTSQASTESAESTEATVSSPAPPTISTPETPQQSKSPKQADERAKTTPTPASAPAASGEAKLTASHGTHVGTVGYFSYEHTSL